MDYDKTRMPANYDAGRGYPPAVLAFWLDVIARNAEGVAVNDILDLGCGTGRFSAALAERFGARVVAVDPSEQMLNVARTKTHARVRFERGRAEDLPLASASVDMVFISLVFHHFTDRAKALGECRRVLRPRGVICMRAGTREQIGHVPYMAFFPGAAQIAARVLQSHEEIKAAFGAAGFKLAHHEAVPSQTAESCSEYAQKVSQRADSILTQLPDDAFAEGVARLNLHAQNAGEGTIVEPVDFFVFR